jgi:hypothetical protein
MGNQRLLVFFFFTFIFTCFSGFAGGNDPASIDSVDFNRIQQKKVRKLIHRQKQYGVQTFADLHPACFNSCDSNAFRTFVESKLIRQDISVVWNDLIHEPPGEEFTGRIVSFGLLYSRKFNNFLYGNESYGGIEEGQILFFNLRMLGGLKNIAVAVEVTRLDAVQKEVEYCYIDHGMTTGTQTFTLRPTPDGFTEITQVTKYKCKSQLRDKRLYSFFHQRIVEEFFSSFKAKSESHSSLVTGEL